MRVVIGGGISGVCCAQELARLNPREEIVIVTATETLLETKSVFAWSRYLEEIDVFEKTADQFVLSNPNIRIIQDVVDGVNPESRTVHLQQSNTTLQYSQLCLCTGVCPKLIADHPRIVGIRDLWSVKYLVDKLHTARKVVVVGNGGIALELIHELQFLDIHWVIRESYVGAAFFDESASDFIMPTLLARDPTRLAERSRSSGQSDADMPATETAPIEMPSNHSALPGSGLGPAWLSKTKFLEQLPKQLTSRIGYLQMHMQSEIAGFSDDSGRSWTWLSTENQQALDIQVHHWHESVCKKGPPSAPFYVVTTRGDVIVCDLVISATGVQPNHREFLRSVTSSVADVDSSCTTSTALLVNEDGFIMVNRRFETSIPSVFAAGDCCQYCPSLDGKISTTILTNTTRWFQAPHFFQLRLWTQARIMGTFVAQCMCNVEDDYGIDQHLELFAHVTRFFGFKVVLLGRYNAQGAGNVIERVAKRTVLATTSQLLGNQSSSTEAHSEGTTSQSDSTQKNASKRAKLESNTLQNSSSPCDLELWSRITPGKQFVKVVVYRGRIIGALLIGDTELEEVFENLILNQLDISALGQDLLDPDLDLADYFD